MMTAARIRTMAIAFAVAVLFVFVFTLGVSPRILKGVIDYLNGLRFSPFSRIILIVVGALGVAGAMTVMVLTVVRGRLRSAHIHHAEIGDIDIGVGAIQNIALNAAKASQSGVKAAKASVGSIDGVKLVIAMTVLTYPDVELPVMMRRVQERVKKDVEKYTGFEVADVSVRVAHVETVATRVER